MLRELFRICRATLDTSSDGALRIAGDVVMPDAEGPHDLLVILKEIPAHGDETFDHVSPFRRYLLARVSIDVRAGSDRPH